MRFSHRILYYLMICYEYLRAVSLWLIYFLLTGIWCCCCLHFFKSLLLPLKSWKNCIIFQSIIFLFFLNWFLLVTNPRVRVYPVCIHLVNKLFNNIGDTKVDLLIMKLVLYPAMYVCVVSKLCEFIVYINALILLLWQISIVNLITMTLAFKHMTGQSHVGFLD